MWKPSAQTFSEKVTKENKLNPWNWIRFCSLTAQKDVLVRFLDILLHVEKQEFKREFRPLLFIVKVN